MKKIETIKILSAIFVFLLILALFYKKNIQLKEEPGTIVSVATLQAYPTPISVLDYKDQVTDNQLMLSTKEIGSDCHKPNMPIKIQLIFTNLTDQVLSIPSKLTVALSRNGNGGNILPQITDVKKIDVFSIGDLQFVDAFREPSSGFIEILAKENYISTIDFFFPSYLAENSTSEMVISTPVRGSYFVRFVYLEYERNENTWFGMIGSNRIEICIL